jgi:hypothetical protein
MTFRLVMAAAGVFALAAPLSAAHAQSINQSVNQGVEKGAATGGKAAGPVGAAVGSVMGGTAYGFRAGASKVLGIPQETGSVNKHRAPHKKMKRH